MDNNPRPHELVIMIGGAVTLLFSFFTWFEYGASDSFGSSGDSVVLASPSAWGSGLFPLATLVPLFGLLMAVGVALTRFTSVEIPESIVGFGRTQIHLLLSGYMVIITVAFFFYAGNAEEGGVTVSAKFGYFLSLLGAIALLVGSILEYRETEGAGSGGGGYSAGPSAPPQPF